jgi:hypothetical protein
MEDLDKIIIHYDKSKDQFNKEFPKINSVKFKDSNVDLDQSLMYINEISFQYNIIGRFDNSTNIWEWGWVNEYIKNKVYYTAGLLKWSIDVIEEKDYIVKNILINSKIQITNKINIDIILAITLRFLSSFGFIYIHAIKESNNIYKYYILKIHK